ncbi:MAG: hypothetical protein OCC45_04350 [Desulfotalea sp.]
MNKKVSVIALASLLFFNLPCLAQQETTTTAVTTSKEVAANAEEPNAETGVLVSLEELENLMNQDQTRLEKSGKFSWVGSAVQQVSVDKENQDWGKARVIAAQKAMIETENKFAKEFGQRISSEKVKEYYADANENIPDFDFAILGNDAQWGRIYEKVMTLTEGQLDQALDELGIDTADLAKVPKEQRHLKFRDSFVSTVTREAMAELSGMLTYKTYEGFDKNGQYQVAVLMILSPKMKQLAWDIGHKRGQLKPVAKKIGSQQIQQIVDAPAVSLIPDFGVKRMYDPEGYPVIVSFGQWSLNTTTGDAKKLARKQAHAKKQAEAQADQAIAEFINSRINYSDMSQTGEETTETGIVDSENFKRMENITEIIDITREKAKKKSRVNIIGIKELRRWSAKHPDNDKASLVGVIRYWSPVNEKEMRDIRKWKPGQKDASKTKVKIVKPNIKASQERMSMDDF